MNQSEVVQRINSYLHESATALASWLGRILPRVDSAWWEECVLANLTYAQRDIAEKRNFEKLEDFDLAALLRVANKSWYDMRTVAYLPTSERECIREMISVRNNWAHCSAQLPDKDSIIHDLRIIKQFFEQIGCSKDDIVDVGLFIELIEAPDSISATDAEEETTTEDAFEESSDAAEIVPGSLVRILSSPNTIGMVRAVTPFENVVKYSVFVNNATKTYYTGQIERLVEESSYQWVDIETFRSRLTAYQINNPSSQNLYSLNSARIDFVPYQFRPALKMINADEPRILIADSVGVGKTIEAGLIVKELAARKANPEDLERIAIICPKPLVAEHKWEYEMQRFDEDFVAVTGAELRSAINDANTYGQWPARYNKIIIPYSILDSRTYEGSTEKRLPTPGLIDLDPAPHFDLVIVDEAHHIRNGSMEKEKAFAYKCTKFLCDHADAVVMMTATPLQTSDNDLFTLLNVLRPDIIIDQQTFAMMSHPNKYISQALHLARAGAENWQKETLQALLDVRKTHWGDRVIADNPLYDNMLIRLERDTLTREDRVQLITDIESLHSFHSLLNRTRRRDIQDFCVRHPHTISTEFTPYQKQLHDELLAFERIALSRLHNPRSVNFMMSTIRRQAASCIFGLAPHLRDIISRRFRQMNDDVEIDELCFDGDEKSADILASLAKNVLTMADQLPEEDPKFEAMLSIILQKQSAANNKIMLFSTFRHTLAYLKDKLRAHGLRVEQIDGSTKDEQRYLLKEYFELPKEHKDALDILLFTEVGSEGLDYQFCDMMINYDLPWNPMRIEQRIGRIDRRGQQSEAVNIYNLVTEDTVDADIYHRCLLRIGVFESSIGDCEEILGELATEIEKIAVDTSLSEKERKQKLEQIADNEVRRVQELNRLETEEKELFGFDLSEFMTTQEIRKAENTWLSQKHIQGMIELYFKNRLSSGASILGEGLQKTLRISASGRAALREDVRSLTDRTNKLRYEWEGYLKGKNPICSITFDPEVAKKNRSSIFITAMHPLARQAARYFDDAHTPYLKLECYDTELPSGSYAFSVYAWKYSGKNSRFRMVTVCQNDAVAVQLEELLESAVTVKATANDERSDWDALEILQAEMLAAEIRQYKEESRAAITFRTECLANNYRNQARVLEGKINDAYDASIKRMYMGELEAAQETYHYKLENLRAEQSLIDIHSTLLANGVIAIRRE